MWETWWKALIYCFNRVGIAHVVNVLYLQKFKTQQKQLDVYNNFVLFWFRFGALLMKGDHSQCANYVPVKFRYAMLQLFHNVQCVLPEDINHGYIQRFMLCILFLLFILLHLGCCLAWIHFNAVVLKIICAIQIGV